MGSFRFIGMKRIAAGALMLLLFAGCNDGPAGIDVEGDITYNKAPVESGMIRFVPAVEGQQPVYAEFENGHYVLKGDMAPRPGSYTVAIDGFKKVKDAGAPDFAKDENGMVAKPILPPKYNTQTSLTVDIKADQTKYDFHLEK